MIFTYDPVSSLRHYPISLERFGKNPHGQPMFRIVFAPSRRHLVCGQWPDGANCARWVEKYFLGRERSERDVWIMERWISAEEFTGGKTPAQWNSDPNANILGPYPDRGEYEICHEFAFGTPTDASLDRLIPAIMRRHRMYDQMLAIRDEADREKKAIDSQKDSMIRDWLPAFGTRPFSGYGGGRSQKSAPVIRTAEELGLPTKGPFIGKPQLNPKKFAVPVTV